MSIGGPAFSPLQGFTGTAPDAYQEVICPGANSMTIQIANQAVQLLFGAGPGKGAIVYEPNPETYTPVTGSIGRSFDAFKIRALVPAAQLPAGTLQAYAILTPRQ